MLLCNLTWFSAICNNWFLNFKFIRMAPAAPSAGVSPTRHVCDCCSVFVFFFLSRFQEFCVVLVEVFGRWFWKEWMQTLVVALQLLPLYLPSCLRVRLWAGHADLLGYCLTRNKQNQFFSLIMLMFVGGSWSCLYRELLSMFVRMFDGF